MIGKNQSKCENNLGYYIIGDRSQAVGAHLLAHVKTLGVAFDFKVVYRPGKTEVADALSRLTSAKQSGSGSSMTLWVQSSRIDHFTVVAKLPGFRMEARLPVTLF